MSNHPLPLPLLGLCASGQAFAKQNYRALWVMICPFVPYSRWLEAESTPLPLSSIPMHIRRRWLFLPYSCFQGREARGVTLPAEGCHGGESLPAESRSGLQPEGPDSNARHMHGQRGDGIFTLTHTTWLCKTAAPFPHLPILLGASGSESWDASGMSLLKPLFLCLKPPIL